MNRINLINGLVQTFGLGLILYYGLISIVIWAYFVIMGLNKCCYLGLFCYCGCYLSYFFIIYFLLFGFFIFGYSELGLLDQGVHKLFEGE